MLIVLSLLCWASPLNLGFGDPIVQIVSGSASKRQILLFVSSGCGLKRLVHLTAKPRVGVGQSDAVANAVRWDVRGPQTR